MNGAEPLTRVVPAKTLPLAAALVATGGAALGPLPLATAGGATLAAAR